MKLIALEHSALDTVARYNTVLSQEDLTSSVFSSGGIVSQRLREMFFGTKDLVMGLMGEAVKEEVKTIVDLSSLVTIAESQRYTGMMDIPVSQPNRLSVPWIDYVQVLLHAQEITAGIDKNLLQPFDAYIGKGLNEPNLFTTVSFEPKGYKLVPVKPVKDTIAKCLNGQAREYAPWKQAFKRNQDVKTFAEQLNKLLTRHASLTPQMVNKSLERLLSNCQMLMEEIEKEASRYTLTKKSTQQISAMILATAEHVELFAIVHRLIAELQTCAEETRDAIKLK